MRGGDATPQSQTNATGTSNDDNKSVRAFLPTPSSLPPPSSAETRASSAVIASSREGERAPESVLHLAQSPSRLAAVLNANLASRTPTPGESVETEVVSTDALVDRPRVIREGLNAQQTTLDILRPPVEAAQEGSGGLSVEAVIEELYERLRLEFLRTYGTSGE
jgi:hypothetical protein